jgi:hypothetical protein
MQLSLVFTEWYLILESYLNQTSHNVGKIVVHIQVAVGSNLGPDIGCTDKFLIFSAIILWNTILK